MDFVIALFYIILSFFYGAGELVGEPPIPPPSVVMAEVVRVIDGDTIVVNLVGKDQTVRYIGIDTPEPYRDEDPACFSLEATLKNVELVEGKIVRLESDVEDIDRYGRLLRYVYADEVFINAELVAGGYAKRMTIRPNTAHQDKFSELEQRARAQGVGLWGVCESG